MRKIMLAALFCFASAAWAELDANLVQRLREGGHVLFMRHASTDMSQNDAAMKGYDDCANQRNLTERGRDEARAIASQVRRLGIPIGAVLASPFCRTMETARLAFGKAQASAEVRGGPSRTDDPMRYDALRRLLSSPVAKGANLVIASHGNPFYALAGPPYLAEGEIAVVLPEGGVRFTVIARIRPEDWSGLRAGGGRASSGAP